MEISDQVAGFTVCLVSLGILTLAAIIHYVHASRTDKEN